MPHITSIGQARNRAERLADALTDRINAQALDAGAHVGTIASLRSETGFAYATVSEAVRLLRDRGILEVRPGRGGGLFVADAGPVVRLRHTLLAAADNPTEVADAIELRNHLEELIDVGAARCRTADDVADLNRCLQMMESAGSWEEFVQANWSLHKRIAAISPNVMARAVYIGTLGPLQGTHPHLDADTSSTSVDSAAYRARRHEVHRVLVAAIAAGDEAAVRSAVQNHAAHTDQETS